MSDIDLAALTAFSRHACGLPPTIVDPVALDTVARLLARQRGLPATAPVRERPSPSAKKDSHPVERGGSSHAVVA